LAGGDAGALPSFRYRNTNSIPDTHAHSLTNPASDPDSVVVALADTYPDPEQSLIPDAKIISEIVYYVN
jgi:hypothetical protein